MVVGAWLAVSQLQLASADEGSLAVSILYLEQRVERPPVLSNRVVWPEDEGQRGAELAIADNNTTGRFLGQSYQLESLVFEPDESIASRNEAIRKSLADGPHLVIANLSAADLVDVASSSEAADDLFFNARSLDNELRNSSCLSNVLHTSPSRSMLSDALMQFFTYRRWKEIFLIQGNRPGDEKFATALRQSINKFGLKIVEDKLWINDADMRRNAAREVPVFTQARKYDAIVVADEDRDFSQYILYNTWLPRPVAGSAGLTPVAWSPVIEQWGAAQLQSRFRRLAERDMTGVDYSNWAAIRAVGEAITRTGSIDPAVLRHYLLSKDFEMGGFKGASLSFRHWNGQMRQPVQLVHSDAVVATAPLDGFLHPVTELDTLGYDEPESTCTDFR